MAASLSEGLSFALQDAAVSVRGGARGDSVELAHAGRVGLLLSGRRGGCAGAFPAAGVLCLWSAVH